MTGDKVSEEVIASFIGDVSLAVAGVHGMGMNMSASAVAKNVLGQDKKTRGVRVAYDDDTGYTVDIYLIVAFGANIPETAWNVQKTVYEGLLSTYGVDAGDINIHVQGVDID